MPANRAESLARVEPQYLDLVDFITAHPNQVISPASYLGWDKRDVTIDWVSGGKDTTVERAIGTRLSSLAVAHSLPLRPSIPSPYRRTVWLAALLDMGGVFYRTGHGKSASYVLDLQARWRRAGHGRIELTGHRWAHNPNAVVRKLMPSPVYAPDTPEQPAAAAPAPVADPLPDPTPVQLDSVDPTPDELQAAATAAAANGTAVSLAGATYTVEAAGREVGDQLVVRVATPDGAGALLIATVATVLPVVGS